MRACLALLVSALALVSAGPLPSVPAVATPGPIHRYINSYRGNNCSGTSTFFADLGSSPTKLPLNSSLPLTCDATHLGFYNANTATSTALVTNGTISDGNSSMSLVVTGYFTQGMPFSYSITFKPFVGGPNVVYTFNFLTSLIQVLTPSCRQGVFFYYSSLYGTLYNQYQFIATFDADAGLRVYFNGVLAIRSYATTFTNQNCKLGAKNVWTGRPGTFKINIGAANVLQDIQIYSYALSMSQMKSLLPSVVLAPPPPPSALNDSMNNVGTANDYNAAIPLLTHRYLGRMTDPAPGVDGIVIDQIGTANATVGGASPTTLSPSYILNPLYSLTFYTFELGTLAYPAGRGDFTIRFIGGSPSMISGCSVTVRYHNIEVTQANNLNLALTVSSDVSGLTSTRTFNLLQFSPPFYFYTTITVGRLGMRIFYGGDQILYFPAITSSVYNSPHNAWAAIYSSGFCASMTLHDLQVYDVELSPATVIALDQGETVTTNL